MSRRWVYGIFIFVYRPECYRNLKEKVVLPCKNRTHVSQGRWRYLLARLTDLTMARPIFVLSSEFSLVRDLSNLFKSIRNSSTVVSFWPVCVSLCVRVLGGYSIFGTDFSAASWVPVYIFRRQRNVRRMWGWSRGSERGSKSSLRSILYVQTPKDSESKIYFGIIWGESSTYSNESI